MDEPRDSPDDALDDKVKGGGAAPASEDDPVAGPSKSGPATPRPSFKRRHWGKLLLVALVMLPVLVFGLWSVIALNWSYSEGTRPGFVQKISRKGYLCKTWEGILYADPKGFRTDSFPFTVRSDSIARLLDSLSGKQVSLEYQQHVGVPSSCFGDTEYFVTGVRALKN